MKRPLLCLITCRSPVRGCAARAQCRHSAFISTCSQTQSHSWHNYWPVQWPQPNSRIFQVLVFLWPARSAFLWTARTLTAAPTPGPPCCSAPRTTAGLGCSCSQRPPRVISKHCSVSRLAHLKQACLCSRWSFANHSSTPVSPAQTKCRSHVHRDLYRSVLGEWRPRPRWHVVAPLRAVCNAHIH